MRLFALMLAACAASTLNWSAPARCEERLAHISVETLGTGAPLVLIPGLSTPPAVWDQVAPDLAKSHQLLVVQVNGFAGDDPGANLQGPVLDGIVADLHSYLANHHAKPARIVGHSMGGLVALKFALAHPDQVNRVMVVDALPFFGVLIDPSATVDAVRPMAAMMRTKIAAAYGKPADPANVEANVKSLALKPTSIVRMKAWAAAADPRVTAQSLYDDLTTDIRPQLAGIAAPVTVIVPWSDQGFGEQRTLAFYQRQYATLPKATFVGIGDAGHFVMLDQPQRFAAALDAFAK